MLPFNQQDHQNHGRHSRPLSAKQLLLHSPPTTIPLLVMSVLTRRQQVYHATIQQQDNAGLAYASNKKKSPPIKDKAATITDAFTGSLSASYDLRRDFRSSPNTSFRFTNIFLRATVGPQRNCPNWFKQEANRQREIYGFREMACHSLLSSVTVLDRYFESLASTLGVCLTYIYGCCGRSSGVRWSVRLVALPIDRRDHKCGICQLNDL